MLDFLTQLGWHGELFKLNEGSNTALAVCHGLFLC